MIGMDAIYGFRPLYVMPVVLFLIVLFVGIILGAHYHKRELHNMEMEVLLELYNSELIFNTKMNRFPYSGADRQKSNCLRNRSSRRVWFSDQVRLCS